MDTLKKIPLSVGLIVAAIIIAGAIFLVNNNGGFGNKGIKSAQEVADLAAAFINDKILAGKAKVEIVSVTDEKGLYKIKFKLNDQEIDSYATKTGELFFPEAVDLAKESQTVAAETSGTTIGEFSVSKDEVIMENGKPVIYFFGSESCPHCKWEQPVIQKVVEKFKDKVSYHESIDSETDKDIFTKYNPNGGVPTLVLAGKYFRVGSGESWGADQEEKYLTALVCKLTGSETQPACAGVQDLISQITE